MMKPVPFLFLSAVLAAPGSVDAQDTRWNRYTLEDLDGVHVRIEVGEVCQAAGVSASDFEASTSLQLIEAEVGVLTREEMLEHLALPELLVTIECGEAAGGSMPYLVGLRVQQAAQMLRDTQITMPEAVTWYANRIGLATAQNAGTVLADALGSSVAAFAEAWNAANAETEGSR